MTDMLYLSSTEDKYNIKSLHISNIIHLAESYLSHKIVELL